MKELSLADIAKQIEELRGDVARVIGEIAKRPNPDEPIAVSASVVARLLSINRDEVYRMHHKGDLNGFRPYPKAHLKFLVSEVREAAIRMRNERRNV